MVSHWYHAHCREVGTGTLPQPARRIGMSHASPPHETSPRALVLHALRCIGVVERARLVAATGLSDPQVEAELAALARTGLVEHTEGVFGGWAITDQGRVVDATGVATELDESGGRAIVTEAFDTFLVLNPELLDICTAWQTRTIGRSMVMNDHSDPVYDGRVLDRLADLDRRADPMLDALAGVLARFRRYRTRLTSALERAEAGALEYVTEGLESYHTVWFQLHEDLLVTLGIPRSW